MSSTQLAFNSDDSRISGITSRPYRSRNESGFPERRLARDCHFSEYATTRPSDRRQRGEDNFRIANRPESV
jgi:hypothetical protein